jgi:hypothetical protein
VELEGFVAERGQETESVVGPVAGAGEMFSDEFDH